MGLLPLLKMWLVLNKSFLLRLNFIILLSLDNEGYRLFLLLGLMVTFFPLLELSKALVHADFDVILFQMN